MTVSTRGLHKDARRIVADLTDLGWVLDEAPHGRTRHLILTPPEGMEEAPIRLPANSRTVPPALRALHRRHTGVARFAEAVIAEPGFVPDPDDAPPPNPLAMPFIVSARPHTARMYPTKRGGVGYESETTVERTWSNGVVDYGCAAPGCDYFADRARSVAAHYARLHSSTAPASLPAPEERLPLSGYTDNEGHRNAPEGGRDTGYRPTPRLVALLAEALRDALSSGGDPEDVAEAALVWWHDRPDLPEPAPAEPLTAEQIVDRIRVLVTGTQVADLTQRAEAAEAAMRGLHLALEEAHETIDRLHADRKALRDLLADDPEGTAS